MALAPWPVAALAALAMALSMPGCLGCASEGYAFVVWRDPSLYAAFDGHPGWGEDGREGLPFDLAVAGIPPGGAVLRQVKWGQGRTTVEVQGNATEAVVRVALAADQPDVARQATRAFLGEATTLPAAEADALAEALAGDLAWEHGDLWAASASLPSGSLRLAELYQRLDPGDLVVALGLVGNVEFQDVEAWTFVWYVKTKHADDGPGDLTVFATGDAKYAFRSGPASRLQLERATESMLRERGLPANVDPALSKWSNSCV
jgi:hypothetical protein